MTITNTNYRTDTSGNGATKIYPFTFPIESEGEISVFVANPDTDWADTELVLNTDFSVDVLGQTITLIDLGQAWLTAGFLNAAWPIAIKRKQPLTQTADIRNLDRLRLDELENQYDRLVKICLMLAGQIASCLKTPEIEAPIAARTKIPARQVAGGTVIGFDATGTQLLLYAVAGVGGPVVAEYILRTGVSPSLLPNHRVLAGTPNQIIIADGGAAGPLTLSTPQDLAPTSTPSFTQVTVTGKFHRPLVTKAQITADQNDYACTGDARISSDAARAITGIAESGVTNGTRKTLMNVGAFTITLRNQNAGSSAGNRIITGTGADLALAADQMVELVYDSTVTRWRVMKNA